MKAAHWLLIVGLVIAAGSMTGCNSGSKRYGAFGTVTYKGVPIKSGIISFLPKGTDVSAGGAAIVDGKYEVSENPGLPPGEYDVVISVPKNAPAKAAEGEEGPGEGGERETEETLPAKYNSMTELKAVIKEEKNQIDFKLE